MKFALAAITLVSAILSGSADARPVRRACPVKHQTTSSPAVTTSTAVPAATSTAVPATTSDPVRTTSVAAPSVPATTSSAAPAPSVTTAPSTGSGAHPKRGLSFNNAADTVPFGDSVSWVYNWDSTLSGTVGTGQIFVPMLWGTGADHTNRWKDNAEAAITAGATHFLGFNEPDLGQQANLSPEDAAAAWKTYMNPYAGRVKLVSPAVTNGPADQNMGLGWLDKFFAACNGGCHVDAVAIHIYDQATNIDYFKNYITEAGQKYNMPVWVTEFGANGSDADKEKFVKAMVPFLDDLASVEKYAYFGIPSGEFVSGSSILPIGRAYQSA